MKLDVVADAPASATITPRDHQRFSLKSTDLQAGGSAELVFPEPMHAVHGEQFWATVVERGAADTSWGKYDYVGDGARTLKLPLPSTAGDFEIRLHANYPRLTTNVVFRVPIHLAPAP